VRIMHWLFVVGVLLFVSGIGFVIAGARAARQSPAAATPAVTVENVASVKQIMKGITGPAAGVIFDAVTTTVTKEGVEDVAPQTEAEWETVGNSAAALVESGNLMLIGSRVVDTGDWVKMSRAMIDSGKMVLRATQEKSPQKILEAGEIMNKTCDTCHAKYSRGA